MIITQKKQASHNTQKTPFVTPTHIHKSQHNRPYPSKYKAVDICIDICKYNGIVTCKDGCVVKCIGVCMPNVMQQLFVMNIESLLKEYAAYRAFNKSDAVINMRIPRPVLDRLKELAAQQHVPYQSLISSILFSLANTDENKQ